jgi:hypothetical protein
MKLTEDSDARTTPCPSALDEAELEAGDTADSEVSDATHTESESPPASTVQNESSGQYAFSSDVSGDEDSAMTLLTDRFDQGNPEPIATRKEIVPVRLPAVWTHRTADTNRRAH